jgi:hypothetical protein
MISEVSFVDEEGSSLAWVVEKIERIASLLLEVKRAIVVGSNVVLCEVRCLSIARLGFLILVDLRREG